MKHLPLPFLTLCMTSMVGLFFLSACNNTPEGKDAAVSEKGEEAKASMEATTYKIITDEKASAIRWEGYKPTKTHYGTVNIQSGEITVKDQLPESGSVVIDMSTIEVKDLEGEGKEKLTKHLKGLAEGREDDFFNITKYPTTSFTLTKVRPLENDSTANIEISGNLRLRDTTQQITFKGNMEQEEDKIHIWTDLFTIDRTQWGINFMSKSVVDDVKDGFIEDKIGLAFDIMAQKEN